MSAVLEQVKPEIFESVNYYDTRTVGKNEKRWVFFPGDLIVPQRKAEISWLRVGGEETPNPCLQKYGRGFVPRGLAAMMEMGGEPIPMKHLGELQSSAWSGMALNNEAVKNKMGFIPVYPGDGLMVLRRYSMNDGGMRKGMDELTALIGKHWEECHTPDGTGILDVIERAAFGDGMAKTLRGLEDQIRYLKVNESRIDVGKYQADALKMCEEFRNWATRKVTLEHGLLKTGHVGEWQGGWSYAYSPVAELLLEQLEMPRQDQPLQEMSKLVGSIVSQPQQPQAMSASDMDLFEKKMEAMLAKAREADAARIAELEAKLETEAAKFTCEHCGEEMKLSSKGFHIGRHCKVLHPKESE